MKNSQYENCNLANTEYYAIAVTSRKLNLNVLVFYHVPILSGV